MLEKDWSALDHNGVNYNKVIADYIVKPWLVRYVKFWALKWQLLYLFLD